VPYFHVRLSILGRRSPEIKVDIDEGTLERQFLSPYRSGLPITVSGSTFSVDRIDRIQINKSDIPTDEIIPLLKVRDSQSSVAIIGGPSYLARAAAWGEDVTDQFITGPPGEASDTSIVTARGPHVDPPIESSGRTPGNQVFLIAGRDREAILGIKDFLRALGLQIIEWSHAVAKTGLPNPYIGDVVMEGLRMADVAIVVITPDDLVSLREDLRHDDDDATESETLGQGRPNVYYEAGIADAIGRERTLIIEIGPVKKFSDISGRHVIRYDGSPAMRNTVVDRLRIAGIEPNTSGNDWLEVGDIGPSIEAAFRSLG